MSNNLSEYNKKRDFNKTPEPQSNQAKNKDNELKYVIQHHLASRDHYDFRLEWQGVMLSWAIPKGPSYNPNDKRLAIKVEDHPLDYRNFEGIIPKGQYGGGTVMIWDEGYWEPYHTDIADSLNNGVLKFTLKGIRLKGRWALIQIKDNSKQDNWLLIKEKDKFAKNHDGIKGYTTSIRTKRTLEEISNGLESQSPSRNPFVNVAPQLAQYSSTIPKGNDWLFELKYDGYRIISFIENNSVRLVSRNGKDYTSNFRDIANSLLNLAEHKSLILDGEITATDTTGKISFQCLQNYLNNSSCHNLTYFIFDILAREGEDIRSLPLIDRKNILKDIMHDSPTNLHYSDHFFNCGNECYSSACKAGLEGIVAKNVNSHYSSERNNNWLKIKCIKRQEFVIGGYTISTRRLTGLSSILVGAYNEDNLIYYGRVGTGFTQLIMEDLTTKLNNLKTNSNPFTSHISQKKEEEIIWVKPKLVAEIKYAEITADNLLRHASFQGLRQDKEAKAVVLEETKTQHTESEEDMQQDIWKVLDEIKITNPNKTVFSQPLLTKNDVVQYYAKIAHKILPFIKNRILSVVRCPKGVDENCFYKKHPLSNGKGIIPITVDKDGEKQHEYFYIDSFYGLLYEVQMGTLEFHTWQSSALNLEKPDIMVFDLDPDEGMDIGQIRKGVMDLKSILDDLSLTSFLKTSGGKGYHIVVPFAPNVDWETFYNFAKKVAQLMEAKWSNLYTSNMRKESRKGRIFIDWVRNGRGATSIAPYSMRARQGATVSMPIAWEELNTVAPNSIAVTDVLYRITQQDPWHDFFNIVQTFA